MAQAVALKAEQRSKTGTGPARAVREQTNIPAIIYGGNKTPTAISLSAKDVLKQLESPKFFSQLYDIHMDSEVSHVLARDVQVHPVTDRPLHVDFMRVTDSTRLKVDVKVRFINDQLSKGIKAGGVVNVVSYELEVLCRADSIPEEIVIDLAGTDIGHVFHASDIKLPSGVELANKDPHVTVASIVAPAKIEEEAPVAAAADATAAAAPAAGATPAAGAAGAKPGAPAAAGAKAPAAAAKPADKK